MICPLGKTHHIVQRLEITLAGLPFLICKTRMKTLARLREKPRQITSVYLLDILFTQHESFDNGVLITLA